MFKLDVWISGDRLLYVLNGGKCHSQTALKYHLYLFIDPRAERVNHCQNDFLKFFYYINVK